MAMTANAENFFDPNGQDIAQAIEAPGVFHGSRENSEFTSLRHYDGRARLAINLDKIVKSLGEHYQSNPTLLQRIVEWIRSLVERFKSFIGMRNGEKHLVAEAMAGSPEYSQIDSLREDIDAVLKTLLTYPGDKKETIDRLLESNGARDIFRFKIASMADLLAKSTDMYQALRSDLEQRMNEVGDRYDLNADAIRALFQGEHSQERELVDPTGEIAGDIARIDQMYDALEQKRTALGLLINSAVTSQVLEVEDVYNVLANYKIAVDPEWVKPGYAASLATQPAPDALAAEIATQKPQSLEELLASVKVEVAPMEGAEIPVEEPKSLEELLAGIEVQVAPMDDYDENITVINTTRPAMRPGM